MEQLLVLTLAIVAGLAGLVVHVMWIAAIVIMTVLWGYMASTIGGTRRGGVASDLVTAVSDEARTLARDVAERGSFDKGDPREAYRDDGRGDASRDAVTKQDLYDEARELGIEGRSTMNKAELREALEDESTSRRDN